MVGYPFLSFMNFVVLKDGVEEQQERNVICELILLYRGLPFCFTGPG